MANLVDTTVNGHLVIEEGGTYDVSESIRNIENNLLNKVSIVKEIDITKPYFTGIKDISTGNYEVTYIIEAGALPNIGTKTVTLNIIDLIGITGLSYVTFGIDSAYAYAGSTSYPFMYENVTAANNITAYIKNSTTLTIITKANWSSYKGRIILKGWVGVPADIEVAVIDRIKSYNKII